MKFKGSHAPWAPVEQPAGVARADDRPREAPPEIRRAGVPQARRTEGPPRVVPAPMEHAHRCHPRQPAVGRNVRKDRTRIALQRRLLYARNILAHSIGSLPARCLIGQAVDIACPYLSARKNVAGERMVSNTVRVCAPVQPCGKGLATPEVRMSTPRRSQARGHVTWPVRVAGVAWREQPSAACAGIRHRPTHAPGARLRARPDRADREFPRDGLRSAPK